jgi:dipeptidyl aminopeptidase/acylaminoacyl peptidase
MRHNFRPHRLAAAAVVASGGLCLLAAPGPASAVVPGSNGLIVMSKCEEGTYRCRPVHLWTVDPVSGAEHQLTSGSDVDDTPAWSPDGGRVVFGRCPTGANCRVATVDASGANKSDLTDGSVADDSPSYSPDGSRIVFTRGSGRIYTMNADGTNVTPVGAGAAGDTPVFSPDGSSIAFGRYDSGIGYRIFKVRSRGGTPVPLTSGPGDFDPSFSPDGSRIVFSRGARTQAVWIMDSAGGGEHALTAPATGLRDEQPTFSPDGTQIVFQHTTDGPTATSPLMAINADGSNQHAITGASEYLYKPDWQPQVPAAAGSSRPASGRADSTAPGLTLAAPRRESLRRSWLYLFATSTEPASGVVKGRVTVPTLATSYRLRATSKALSANSRTKIWVKIPSKRLRAIRATLARHERLIARIALKVTDAAGNATRKRLAIRLRK